VETISAAFDWLVWVTGRELLLFAAIGILLIGVDDLLFDGLWMAAARRGGSANPRLLAHERMRSGLAPTILPKGGVDRPMVDGPMAIFLPAWREGAVLPDTLRRMMAAWSGEDYRIFIGCYPNDRDTLDALSGFDLIHGPLRRVIADRAGPTTKGHNLNQMWLALAADERDMGRRYAAVILHDAEDIVHAYELALYRKMLAHHSMVQIPVHALIVPASQWIGGHYADEFAEAHGKELKVRSAFGLPIPSAGVGCALSRDAVSVLAMERDGSPFREDSLTEDYEIGILIGTYGLSAIFVDARTETGDPIVSKGEFPGLLEAAVKQKARWISGIALAGWGHLGWPQLPAVQRRSRWIGVVLGHWMLWRDRRAPLAAIVILSAYLGVSLSLLHGAGRWLFGWQGGVTSEWLYPLLAVNGPLLVWRLGVRAYFTTLTYGLEQGLRSIPRAFVANLIAIMASYRAVRTYITMVRSGKVVWSKTDHGAYAERFPIAIER
jgi:adsorption protein B